MRFTTAVLAGLLSVSCAAYTAQKKAADPQTTQAIAEIRKVTIDPEITKQFDQHPLAMKQAVVTAELDRYIEELKAQGMYDCCVKPACRNNGFSRMALEDGSISAPGRRRGSVC